MPKKTILVRLMRALEHIHAQHGPTHIRTQEVRLTIYADGRPDITGLQIIDAIVECAEARYPDLLKNLPCITCKADPCVCDLPF